MPEEIKNIFTRAYAERDSWVHKGDFGYALIVAGSKKYSGSPVFNAMGALRAGADLVVLRGHMRAMDIAAHYAPDIITEPFSGEFGEDNILDVMSEMDDYSSLIIGCGMERSDSSFAAIRTLTGESTIPMVLDAEALRAISGHTKHLDLSRTVLTPNSEEFRILTGEDVGPDEEERKEKVMRWAKALGATILLKGHVDVISDGERVFANTTGTTHMTKGGFGDVLSGIAGALLARGLTPFDAACFAAYVNGRVGEIATEKYGEGVLASDMIDLIPLALKAIQKEI